MYDCEGGLLRVAVPVYIVPGDAVVYEDEGSTAGRGDETRPGEYGVVEVDEVDDDVVVWRSAGGAGL